MGPDCFSGFGTPKGDDATADVDVDAADGKADVEVPATDAGLDSFEVDGAVGNTDFEEDGANAEVDGAGNADANDILGAPGGAMLSSFCSFSACCPS